MAKNNFLIRLTHWEYWPFGIIQFPFFIYYLYLAAKARSLLFFTASNPAIPMGGMLGESKHDILLKLPSEVNPRAVLIKLPTTRAQILSALASSGLRFPVIFKPDLGERGYMVRRINHEDEIDAYLHQVPGNFIIQEFVDLPMEFGVFYRRFPDEASGCVTSIVMKEMLHVVGDGSRTLRELVLTNDRARLQFEKLKVTYADQLTNVPQAGKRIELVSIGNHCLGTKFLNGNHLITPRLSEAFDRISKQIEGFYFGRFDLRCASLDDLAAGRVMVMELNGCGAEPAHIYQPGFPLWKALGVLYRHWSDMYTISRQNHRRGVSYTSLQEGLAYYRKFKAAIRS